MIRTFTRPADERDLDAMAPPGTSFALNLMRGSLPVSLVVFGLVYLVSRSLLIAGVLALAVFVASVTSNVRWFGEVARRSAQKADPREVEVIEVEAARVWDIEPVGDMVRFGKAHQNRDDGGGSRAGAVGGEGASRVNGAGNRGPRRNAGHPAIPHPAVRVQHQIAAHHARDRARHSKAGG